MTNSQSRFFEVARHKLSSHTRAKVDNRIHRTVCLSICLILGMAAMLPAKLSAQSIQRMFSTPATRAELDRRRFRQAAGIEVVAPEAPPEKITEFTDEEDVELVYALGGSMRKADGSFAIWINDRAYDQSSLPENMELQSPFSQGRLRISDTSSGASYVVKPGQVLNLTTGQLYESYQYQAILAAQVDAATLATEEAVNASDGTGSAILDSAAVENLLNAAQDL